MASAWSGRDDGGEKSAAPQIQRRGQVTWKPDLSKPPARQRMPEVRPRMPGGEDSFADLMDHAPTHSKLAAARVGAIESSAGTRPAPGSGLRDDPGPSLPPRPAGLRSRAKDSLVESQPQRPPLPSWLHETAPARHPSPEKAKGLYAIAEDDGTGRPRLRADAQRTVPHVPTFRR